MPAVARGGNRARYLGSKLHEKRSMTFPEVILPEIYRSAAISRLIRP